MTNPYQVLGVGTDATEEEIKNTYRKLAEKYGSDNYAGNPLADLAEKKMQEINDAYDRIMAERRVGGSGARGTSSSSSDSGYSANYADVRALLNSNQIDAAENRLLQVPVGGRNAEWNFLMGSVHYSRGWLDEADRYFSTAQSMEPGNREYYEAHSRMQRGKNGRAAGNPYGGYNAPRTVGGCSGCDICTGLMCADCCCNCMGGRGLCC